MNTQAIEFVLHVQLGTTEPRYILDNLGMYRKLVSSRSLQDYGHNSFLYTTKESNIQQGVNTGPDLPEVNPAFYYSASPFAVIDNFSAGSTLPKVYVYLDGFNDAFEARDRAILETPRAMDIMIYDTATPGRFKVGYLANQIVTEDQMKNFLSRYTAKDVTELCRVHANPDLFKACNRTDGTYVEIGTTGPQYAWIAAEYRIIQNMQSKLDWYRTQSLQNTQYARHIDSQGAPLPLASPVYRGERDPFAVLDEYENGLKPKVIGFLTAQNEFAARDSAILDPSDNNSLALIYPQSDPTLFKAVYIVDEIATPARVKAFQQKYTKDETYFLMIELAKRPGTACETSPCSLAKDLTAPLGEIVRQWMATLSEAERDAAYSAICPPGSLFNECACVLRQRDPVYQKFILQHEMNDSCWYLPCKNTSTHFVPSGLLRPVCPDTCKIINDYTNINNLVLTDNHNIINCGGSPTPVPVPVPTPVPVPVPVPPPVPQLAKNVSAYEFYGILFGTSAGAILLMIFLKFFNVSSVQNVV
jgi:hypothetical protein